MATETAPAKVKPAQDWSESEVDEYTSTGHAAGSVAWNLLTHSAADAADIALVLALPTPKGLKHDDMWAFVFNLIEDAGRIGYLTAKVEPAALATGAPASLIAIARSVAALVGCELIEDEPTTIAEGAAA